MSGGKGLLWVALLLGLAAAGAMAFVMIEPIAAYDSLAAGTYSFEEPLLSARKASRMSEAALPTAAGIALGAIGLLLALIQRKNSAGLSLGALILSGASALSGVYVFASYPLQF